MGTRRMLITPEVFLSITRGTYSVIRNATPADARILGAGYDEDFHALYVDIESPSYSVDGDGTIADTPFIQRVEPL